MTDKEKKEYGKAHIKYIELVEEIETSLEKALNEMCDAESRVNSITKTLKHLRKFSADPRDFFNQTEDKKQESEWFSCVNCGTSYLGMGKTINTCSKCDKGGDKSLNLMNIYQSV